MSYSKERVPITDRRNFKSLLSACVFAFIVLHSASIAAAEPWLDTRNSGLRFDLERLSSTGIIKVPINTRPLMWVGILNNLEEIDPKSVPANLRNSYARVMAAGTSAAGVHRSTKSVTFSAASDAQLLRHFGDNSREEGEFKLQQKGIRGSFAYNLELTKAIDPWDGDQSHFDNSYLGMIFGNWIGVVGNLERWWGPAWTSNLILTNNARPTPGITLQRNYSKPPESPMLAWVGPWTATMFISELDDDRFVQNAKIFGMSVGFRPLNSLEVNLRRTAQWGGDGRPESASNFFKLLTGLADNCSEQNCKNEEPGNQLGGIDIRWNLPWYGSSIYSQVIGEDEAGGLPSRVAKQVGMQFQLNHRFIEGLVFLEYDDTSLQSTSSRYNSLYNHSIYKTGYRYQGRAIGATWDNDSTVTSLGFIGYLDNGDRIEARYSYGEINRDNLIAGTSTKRHTVNRNGSEIDAVSAKWQRSFEWGELEVEGRYLDQIIDEYGRQEDKFRVAASLTYNF